MNANQKIFLRLRNKIKHKKNELEFNNKTYTFDGILHCSQEDVFNSVAKDLTIDFLMGYNCTLLAYGQTGSGKTHTIQGTQHDAGILQRILFYIFENGNNFNIKISYIEIYNECIYDLFNSEKIEINLREDPLKGVFLENIIEKQPKTYEECIDEFYKGVILRKTAQTRMNIESSRSHSIFSIEYTANVKNINIRSKFNIVDLAGSERIGYEYTDERQKESGNINRSLLCLGTVIEKLGKEDTHINYRDSKLTHLLKDSLGGNAKLVVIGNIRNDCIEHDDSIINKENFDDNKKRKNNVCDSSKRLKKESFYETINTLEFLKRIKSIKNNSVVNSSVNGDIDQIKNDYKELYIKFIELEKSKAVKTVEVCKRYDIKDISRIVNNLKNKQLELTEEFKKLKGLFFKYLDDLYEERKNEIKNLDDFINKK